MMVEYHSGCRGEQSSCVCLLRCILEVQQSQCDPTGGELSFYKTLTAGLTSASAAFSTAAEGKL